jgi:hypothetical protein
MNAAERSPFIQIAEIDAMEGWPAEKYIVTYTCRGLARLADDGTPEFSDHHQMKLELSSAFPANEPSLLWMTDIWHPNIGHVTRHVCTNELATWYPQKSLLDFVVGIGEMIQYKHYFARAEPPYPEDPEVAKWVREVAEPRHWIGPNRPVDPRPMLKEYAIRKMAPGTARPDNTPPVPEEPPPIPRPRGFITLGKVKPMEPPPEKRIRIGRLVE